MPRTDRRIGAVIFDLFGTLVDAPTPADRAEAAARLAGLAGHDSATVERYFTSTWRERHDGTLPTVGDLADHLIGWLGTDSALASAVADEFRREARPRLEPDPSVLETLGQLRRSGYRIGLLSDASAEIAKAWPSSPLAAFVGSAVFSCQADATKPAPVLYRRIVRALAVPAGRTIYCGDGGGDELHGADTAGMTAVAVRTRGPADALVFGEETWAGPTIDAVERLPYYLAAHP